MQCSFVLSQKTIVSLLASMQPICTKKTTREVTSMILFQITPRELTLKSTDLEISLQATIEVTAQGADSVSFLVSGKRLFEVLREIDEDILFTYTPSELKLAAGAVNLSLTIQSAEDFPQFPERIENLMHLDAPFLVSLLNKVAFLVPQNNAHAALNGLYLEVDEKALSMVATDGHSLAHVSTSRYTLLEKHSWLLPKRAIIELKKIIETNVPAHVFLGVCGNQLVFSGANFNFFTKLIAESYPHYEQILHAEGFFAGTVDRQAFTRTLKRTASLLAGQFVAATCTFKPQELTVALENKEVGRLNESLSLNYDGSIVQCRFYTPYLLSGLQVMDDEAISFSVKNGSKPILFSSHSNDVRFIYLVMPVSPLQTSPAQ